MMTRTHIRKQFLSTALTALLLVGAGVFLVSGNASAQLQLLGQAVGLDCNWAGGETFGLGAFTQLAVNALKLIWGILGSLALVMFVWGGFLWLTARGEEQQIKQGWDTLINAVIGILIVFGSWVIINTIVLSLTKPGTWDVGFLFGNEKWTDLVKGDVCVKITPRTPGYVSRVAVTADCNVYCKEEAISRGGTFISVKGETCTPGTVDTTSGSAGYTKVCIKKGIAVCNCEFMAASRVGTPNCGSYGGCLTEPDNLFCEPTTNACKERLGKDHRCRMPLIDRECANGLVCRKDPMDSDYTCKEIAGATVTGICCYNDITAVSSGTGATGSFTVKAQSGVMTKEDCQGKRSAESAATLGHLGIFGLFCPSSVGVTSCGNKDDPYTTSGLAIVEAGSNSTRWSGLPGATVSGCSLFKPDGSLFDRP